MSNTQHNLACEHIRFSVDARGVATALLDVQNERVNTLMPALAHDVEKVLAYVLKEPSVCALVIGSAKKDSFIVGANIAMLDKVTSAEQGTALSREAQASFHTLEALHATHKKPVVAAIDGPALGGGLELALACSMRILSDSKSTVLGLPEVKLGLIPGAGGTQRLPALVGIAQALDMVLTGKNIRARKALQMGLCNAVVPSSQLLQAAQQKAYEAAHSTPKTPQKTWGALAKNAADPEHLQTWALEGNGVGQRLLFKKAKDMLLKKTHGHYPAPLMALDAVRTGVLEGPAAGYASEADKFGQLLMSPESAALRSLFHATQELKKNPFPGYAEAHTQPVFKMGLLGGGLMGGGIAAVTLENTQASVRIKDVDEQALARALAHVRTVLQKNADKKKWSQEQVNTAFHKATGTLSYQGFASVNMVIEAVFEDLELKRKVLKDVENATQGKAIFASNTSSLPITAIAAQAQHPHMVVGMHYFSPVEKMPLLEVVTTEKTAPWVLKTAVDIGQKQGKTVVVVKDGTGFYTTRILSPLLNEAAWLLADYADMADIDQALMQWGFPVGPVTLIDEVGIDVATKVGHVMENAFGKRAQAPHAVESLLKDGRKGRKNGRGLYLYEKGKKTQPDASVYALLDQSQDRKTYAPRDIQERCVMPMLNEAVRCLEEGILQCARDGDVGAVFGLGFPPFLGGPFRYIDRMGAASIVHTLEALEQKHGLRFQPCALLLEHARLNKPFHT